MWPSRLEQSDVMVITEFDAGEPDATMHAIEEDRKRIAFPRFGSVLIVDPVSGETLRLETVMRQ